MSSSTVSVTPEQAHWSVDQQVELYRQMKLMRRFDELVLDLRRSDEIDGVVHPYFGEEAVAAGVCAHLRPDDGLTSTHRGHGHCLAKGASPDRMMAELFGRSTGYCGGKGGSMHVADFNVGMLGANGIVAAGLPIATGAALAATIKGEDTVAVCMFGDGAAGAGPFHESLNIAALWRLPVVFVCENNGYTEWTATEKLTAGRIADRGEPMGIPGTQVDGNDVVAVREVVERAVARARAGDGPSLIEARTYRWHGHNEGEEAFAGNYRPEAEQQSWRDRDPVKAHAERLIAAGHLDQAGWDAIDAEETAAVDDAVAFAKASPFPDPEEALDHLYAAPATPGDPR